MDHRLAAWARAVKARGGRSRRLPPLWLFTDPVRVPDPGAAIAALPQGLCGVVLRGVAAAERPALLRQCRARRIPVVAAGGGTEGVHLHGGRGRRGRGLTTSSAHDWPELLRAMRAGADAVFLSPVFPTASHPGARGLGVRRWATLARRFPGRVFALGGVDGASARRLPWFAAGAGAIGALLR